MNDRNDSNATTEHPERKVDDLIGGGHTVAMVMTMVGQSHSSRPVTCVEAAHGRLSFLVSREVDWVRDIDAGHAVVHVTVADDKANTYLSLEGAASISADIAEIRRLWTPPAKIWFDGPDDPRLAVMRFTVSSGQYWDGASGSIRQGINLVRAIIEGDESVLGTSGAVSTA